MECLKHASEGVAKGSMADGLRTELSKVVELAGPDGLPLGAEEACIQDPGYYWVSKTWLTGQFVCVQLYMYVTLQAA